MNFAVAFSVAIVQGLLLFWQLFFNKNYMKEVVFSGQTDTSEIVVPSWKSSIFFRILVILVSSIFAGISVYSAMKLEISYLEILKITLAILCASLAMITDFYIYIIPNSFLFYTWGARFVLFLVEIVLGRPDWKASGLNSLIGFTVAFVVMFLFSVMTRQGIGMGDVKLMATLGLLCGLYAVINILVYGLILCVGCSIFLLIGRKKSLKDKIPFGPFLYGGLIVTLCTQAF